MRAFLQPDTPLGARLIVAGVGFLAAVYASFAAVMLVDHPTPQALLLAIATAFAACLALGFTWTRQRPRLPLQATLVIAVLASVSVLIELPLPPTASSLGSQLSLVASIVLACVAAATQTRRPRIARGFLAALALVGTLMGLSAVELVASATLSPAARFPTWQIALVVATALAAFWHEQVLRADELTQPQRAAT